MSKTLPLFVITAHDPDGVTRRAIVANFDEVMAAAALISPSKIYAEAESRYFSLVDTLRRITIKGRLTNDDRKEIGDAVVKFDAELKAFSPDLKLEIVNLHQALAEDLGKDINTVETYLLYSRASRDGKVIQSGSPNEAILQSLRQSARPMTPREIASASGVNYNTIRRAVKELLRNGMVSMGPKRGSYVVNAT
jgi:DNA-binding transcriptional ArsR family regulator